jgi:membrane fusion protein, copper/silver efflux system
LRPQQAYIQALNAEKSYRTQPGENSSDSSQSLIQAGVENLEYLGICESQIRHIAFTRKTTAEAEIRAPASGILVLRNAFPGTRFERGTELFRIVDVTKIWVLADLFENEARLLSAATEASIKYQDRKYPASIHKTPPQFDPVSRVLKLRLELVNPDMLLRPEMFVDVEFKLSLPPALAVPVDAIIDSGREKIVYVDKGNGYFDRRLVATGWHLDGRVEIVSGLNEGERIITSGSFLMDSESRVARSVGANLSRSLSTNR